VLPQVFSPLVAVGFTVFVLLYLYTPCMSTVATVRYELETRYMLYQIAYKLVIA